MWTTSEAIGAAPQACADLRPRVRYGALGGGGALNPLAAPPRQVPLPEVGFGGTQAAAGSLAQCPRAPTLRPFTVALAQRFLRTEPSSALPATSTVRAPRTIGRPVPAAVLKGAALIGQLDAPTVRILSRARAVAKALVAGVPTPVRAVPPQVDPAPTPDVRLEVAVGRAEAAPSRGSGEAAGAGRCLKAGSLVGARTVPEGRRGRTTAFLHEAEETEAPPPFFTTDGVGAPRTAGAPVALPTVEEVEVREDRHPTYPFWDSEALALGSRTDEIWKGSDGTGHLCRWPVEKYSCDSRDRAQVPDKSCREHGDRQRRRGAQEA